MVDDKELADTLAPRLALLAALAEEGNLSRAAQRLGVPQPTASRWLAAVSAQAGTPVAIRDGRGIQLTRAGEHLARAAEGALLALRTGCRHVAEEADPERGQVVLAFLHTMGEARVPELLRTFRVDHPSVRFTLVQGAQDEMLERLRTGEADLALTSPPPSTEEFRHAVVGDQPLVVTLPGSHALARRRRIRLPELAGEQFVGMKAGYGLRRITDELCMDAGFAPALAFEGEAVDTVRGLVLAGLGVALLPLAERELPRGVVEVPLTPRAYRRIGLVWAARRSLPPAVLMFRDYVLGGRQVSATRSAQRRSTPASRQ